MGSAKVTITLDERVLRAVDYWVMQGRYPNRSRAIQTALREKIERWKQTRLIEELAKLDRIEERALADEGLADFNAELRRIDATGWRGPD
jgi:Arc/MetJ-type ribon-helix-helix transcriptional regulator